MKKWVSFQFTWQWWFHPPDFELWWCALEVGRIHEFTRPTFLHLTELYATIFPPRRGFLVNSSESRWPWEAQLKAFAKAYRSKQDIEPVPAFFGDMGKECESRLFFFQRKLILRVLWYLNGETRCLGFEDREVFLRFSLSQIPAVWFEGWGDWSRQYIATHSRGHPKM